MIKMKQWTFFSLLNFMWFFLGSSENAQNFSLDMEPL